MTFGLSAGTIAGIVGAGTAIAGAVGGSGGGGPGAGGSNPNIYVPPAGDQAAANSNLNGWNNYLVNSNPWNNGGQQQYQGITNQIVNNPYAAQYQAAASANQPLASWLGQSAQNGAQNLSGLAGMSLQNGLVGMNAAQNNPYTAQANQNGALAGLGYMNASNQQANNAGQLMPAAQNLSAMNNANAAQLNPAAQGINSQLQGLANPLGAAGSSILNTAFDPQSQLYNQQFQQNQDQTNASLARAGLGSSAAGVGISNQSNQNFNTNWQNQQLGREATGLASYGSAAGQAGNLLNSQLGNLESSATTAGNLGAQGLQGLTSASSAAQAQQDQALANLYTGGQLANNTYNNNLGAQMGLLGSANNLIGQSANQYAQSGQLANSALQANMYGASLPYMTSNSIYGNQLNALGQYQQAYNSGTAPVQGGISNELQYLGYGANAGSGYANAAQNSWAQGNQANQQMYQGLGALSNNLFGGSNNGWLSNSFGMGGGGGGGGSGVSTYTPYGAGTGEFYGG